MGNNETQGDGGSLSDGDTPQSEIPSPKSAAQRHGRVGGIDYGTVRIGIAIGDYEIRMASAYENYNRRTEKLDADYFCNLARTEGLVRWVVGLPVHLSGEESQKSHEARAFAKWLTAETGIEVDFFDERYTSAQAEQILQGANLTKKRRKARLDQLAAQIMLTAYLESGGESQTNPGGIEG